MRRLLQAVGFTLLLVGLAGCAERPTETRTATATDAAKAAPAPGTVDRSCKVDADCAVKDVGNCCGYYPACVNKASPTFPDQVQAQCKAEGRMAVCGFKDIQGCACVDGQCAEQASGSDAVPVQ